MATLETLLSQQMIERLGWTLVHFVWQAAAVALLLAVVLRGLRRSSSNVRYVVACLAMALIVALPLVTMSLVQVSRPVAEAGPILNPPLVMRTTPVEVVELPLEPFDAAVPEMPERVTRMPWTQRIATGLEPALPWLVLGWLLGVFGLSAWHLGGWAQLQRMKRRLVSEVAAPLHARAAELAGRLGIRRAIGLWASPLIDVPAVVGWIKPVILLPVGAVTGLSVEQLEAILAHELAHVRRCDYLVNLVQTVVEILGFYHPAVWWVSHRIRDERENCCDDLAVQVCGDSRRYARALTSLEELRHVARASRPRVTEERARARCPRHTAVAASGGSLVGRIARLLGRPPVDHRRFAWLPGLIALLVVAAILIPTALVLATPDAPPTADTIAREPVSDAAPLEVTTQTLHVDQEQDQPKVLVNLLLFTNPMPNKIVDRETKRRIGDVLAPEIPSARQGVASMQNCTLLQILQTWVVGRTLTRHTMEVLVDVLQSRGYLEGEATPEILLTDNVPGHMNLITEELTLPAQDPTSPPKPIALGTFVQLTPHVPPATSDRVTLEIGVEWKSRIEQSDPNNNPTFRATEIASTVTVLRDHYFTLLAEPDDKGNAETGIGEFHLVMLRVDLFEPDLPYATTAAASAPAGKSLSRQVILDIQTVSVEKGSLGDGIVEWSRPQTKTSGWPWGIQMGYTPDRTFTDALRTRLDGLYAQGVARRLAHQRLTTQEGYEARFKAVKEEWFSLAPAPAGNAADPGPEHTSIASGTIITATPTIGDANSITLNLNIEFSESLPKGEGLDLPIITRRTSRNVVTVRDGGTALLAGLSSMISDGVEDVTILVTARLAPEIEPVIQPDHPLPQAARPSEAPAIHTPVPSPPRVATVEPSADAADRQVLLSFTIAEIVTEEALDRATARQLRALLTDASHDAKFNLPSVEELQKPVQYIVSKYANICNQIDDAARAFTDLLVSRGYATVFASPKMLIRLGASGHLTCDMGPPAPPSQTDNPALSLDVTPTAPHDANGIRLTLALRARNLVSLDSKGRFSAKAAYASFDLVLSARNNRCVMLPLTTAVALDAKTTTTLLLVKPTLIEPPAAPALAPSASEQATADAARDFGQTDPMVRELAKRIAEIEVELLEAQQTFLPEHPEIAQKKQLLEAPRRRLEERRRELQQQFNDSLAPHPPSASVAIPTAESEPSGLSTVTATFEGTDLLQVLKTAAEMAGANIMYDANLSGEVYATLDDVPIETALQIILAGSPYVFRKTNYGYEVKMRNAPNVETSSRETDVVEVAARFVLVDRGCMEAMRRGLPIQGVTTPADVNALHEIGSGLAEGRTPLLKPDRVELLLRAVGQYDGSKMLAAPKVTVLDGESASMSLANHIQYTSGYREPNDASQEPIPQHASKEIGMRLDATPHLIEDQNNIRLQFEMEINSLLRMQKALYRGKYEYDIPTFTAVTTATEIVVADGQTALIHIGETPSIGNILRNESEPAGPLLMLIKPSRTPAEPLDPAPPMQPGRRPGVPGMGGLPPDIALP